MSWDRTKQVLIHVVNDFVDHMYRNFVFVISFRRNRFWLRHVILFKVSLAIHVITSYATVHLLLEFIDTILLDYYWVGHAFYLCAI